MSDWQRIQSIFLAAADLPAEERDYAVGVLCEGDIELFEEVHSLLAADNDSSVTIDSAIQGVGQHLRGGTGGCLDDGQSVLAVLTVFGFDALQEGECCTVGAPGELLLVGGVDA